MWKSLALLPLCLSLAGCATLGELRNFVQPPEFDAADGRQTEVRLLGSSPAHPLGAANVRVWLRVRNPNPFGFTLATLQTTLMLDESRAATGDFPLGLPLGARQESEIPIDLAVDFRDVPGLVTAIRSAASGETVGYELQGTVGVDAGALGQPTFGPMPLARGDLGE
jgi:hypothetical protein